MTILAMTHPTGLYIVPVFIKRHHEAPVTTPDTPYPVLAPGVAVVLVDIRPCCLINFLREFVLKLVFCF